MQSMIRTGGHLTRRTILTGGMAGMLALSPAAALAAPGDRFFRRTHIPIGIQLYTVADALQADLDGTLGALARIGYRTVELAGYAGRTPADFRAALDRAGLRCPSSHIGAPGLRGDLHTVAAETHVMGFDTVIMSMFATPERLDRPRRPGESEDERLSWIAASMTADDWKRNADFLNDRAKELRKLGLKLGYHNHNLEFVPVAGSDAWTLMLRHTDPGLVSFELDVGWAAAAGRDPLKLLEDHRGRISALHVKDIKASTRPNTALHQDPIEIGSGIIDWKRILPAAERQGVRRYFVEQEAPFAYPRLESARMDFDYLDRLVA